MPAIPQDPSNRRFVPYNPPNAQKRPASDAWLAHPAWIDGGVKPPQRYFSIEEMNETLAAYGKPLLVLPAALDAPAPMPQPEDHPDVPVQPEHAAEPDVQLDAPVPNANVVDVDDDEEPAVIVAHQTVLVNVGASRTVSTTKATTRGKVQAHLAKEKTYKSARVVCHEDMTRAEFTENLLKIHGLCEFYTISDVSGPPFIIWWKNGPYTKTAAPVVDSDQDFAGVLREILVSKNIGSLNLNIELDLDRMGQYRKNQSLNYLVDPQLELTVGTQVPQVVQFSAEDQLHGRWILDLEKRWKCPHHKNQAGGAGACYWVNAGDMESHFTLSIRRLKFWSAAIAAHQATVEMPPPNMLDGGEAGTLVKPRGVTGPRPASSPASADTSMNDVSAMLTTTMVPMVVLCMKQMMDSMSGSRHETATSGSHQRDGGSSTATPHARRDIVAVGDEVTSFLNDFRKESGLDLTHFGGALIAHDFTPDVLPHLSITRLQKIFDGVAEGSVVKLQLFAKSWTLWLTEVRA